MLHRLLRALLIVFNGFLSLTAIAGGIGLVTGLNAPPVDQLAGTVFPDYFVPGLALLVVVGGGALLTTGLLIRRHRYAPLACMLAGGAIIVFEVVEVLTFGSPEGLARTLQVFYGTLGVVIVLASAGMSAQLERTAAQA